MGYALHQSVSQDDNHLSWKMILLFVVVANLPDIDFLPGLILDDPNAYHHHYLSHSLGFAVFVGAVLGYYFSRRKSRNFLWYFLLFSCVCFSHMVLDYVTADTSEPVGLPMFWPFTRSYYYAPFSVFAAVHKTGGSSASFLKSLLALHNFWVALWEIVVFVPVLTIIKIIHNRKQRLVCLADKEALELGKNLKDGPRVHGKAQSSPRVNV